VSVKGCVAAWYALGTPGEGGSMGYAGGPQPPSDMLIDLYQLTMAYAYWKTGIRDTDAS